MTKAAAPPPQHPTPCSSMKLVLSTVLSLGIAGKCLPKAVLGEKKSRNLPGPQALPLDEAGLELQCLPDPSSYKVKARMEKQTERLPDACFGCCGSLSARMVFPALAAVAFSWGQPLEAGGRAAAPRSKLSSTWLARRRDARHLLLGMGSALLR